MANKLKRTTGKATTAGTEIDTVPTGSTYTIVGLRAANNDTDVNHTFHVEINDTLITGLDTPVPYGSAIDVMEGSKIVAQENDVITAYSDEDDVIDIYISFLEQS